MRGIPNQAPYKVHGYCLFDKVLYNGILCFITGRRSSGYFVLKTLDGRVISTSCNYKTLTLLEHSKSYLMESRANIY